MKKKYIVMIAIIAVAVLLGRWLSGSGNLDETKQKDSVAGTVVEDWDTGIEADEEPEEDPGILIPGYSSAYMKAGDTKLQLSIGNPKENICGMYAVVKLQDGTVLYQSPLLEPGQGLDEIPLEQSLEAGTYKAVVEFTCVTLDEAETNLNSADSGFTLTVE